MFSNFTFELSVTVHSFQPQLTITSISYSKHYDSLLPFDIQRAHRVKSSPRNNGMKKRHVHLLLAHVM